MGKLANWLGYGWGVLQGAVFGWAGTRYTFAAVILSLLVGVSLPPDSPARGKMTVWALLLVGVLIVAGCGVVHRRNGQIKYLQSAWKDLAALFDRASPRIKTPEEYSKWRANFVQKTTAISEWIKRHGRVSWMIEWKDTSGRLGYDYSFAHNEEHGILLNNLRHLKESLKAILTRLEAES